VTQTAVQRFYRYHAYVYDWTRWLILHGRREAVRRLAPQPGSRVLEVGCGTGLNFGLVQERLDAARGRLVGLDFSADMLGRAERRVAARGWTNVELVQADATTMELGRTFDRVLFAYSLTMIPDWRAALRRAREHLEPGGRIVVLDFGPFSGWGPLAPLMRAWLRANHVETLRPYPQGINEIFEEVEVLYALGGYRFTAVATRRADDGRDTRTTPGVGRRADG
jgi:S-adenosylmethionine-diacylgycerolhomoserine-N-methlytransferase